MFPSVIHKGQRSSLTIALDNTVAVVAHVTKELYTEKLGGGGDLQI